MYFEGYSYNDIFDSTHIPLRVFRKHQRFWDKMKEDKVQSLVKPIIEEQVTTLKEIYAMGTQALRDHVYRLVSRKTELTTKDAKLLSDIIANLGHEHRLHEGKPTDIKRYEAMNPDELKEAAIELLSDLQREDPIVDYKKDLH